MNENKRYEGKRDFQPRPSRQDAFPDKDEVVAKEEKWKPTDAVYGAFLVRDERLATGNLRMVLKGEKGMELTLRDIKEQCLHSMDTIEHVLAKLVKEGSVKEGNGKFGPTFTMVGR